MAAPTDTPRATGAAAAVRRVPAWVLALVPFAAALALALLGDGRDLDRGIWAFVAFTVLWLGWRVLRVLEDIRARLPPP